MLRASKLSTIASVAVQTLQISEKELNFFNYNLSTIATQGALLAGFAYQGLAIELPDNVHVALQTWYLLITVLAMGFELVAVTIATFCTIFGPGLALRGPKGEDSMRDAVDYLSKESKVCFYFFMLGLVCFHISSMLLVWVYYAVAACVVVNIVLALFLVYLAYHGLDIYRKLDVPMPETASIDGLQNVEAVLAQEVHNADRRKQQLVEYANHPPNAFGYNFSGNNNGSYSGNNGNNGGYNGNNGNNGGYNGGYNSSFEGTLPEPPSPYPLRPSFSGNSYVSAPNSPLPSGMGAARPALRMNN